jgi:AsmA protein
MKKVLIGFGVLLVLVIAALLIIPAFIPVEVYKREIIAGIESATGRKARIDGDFKLAILPRAEFVAGKVTLGNAKGGRAKTMMSLDRLTVRVGIFPLLSGNLEVDALVAEKPVINLEVDKRGRPNWQFGPAGAPAAAKPGGAAPSAGGPGLAGISLGDVRLVDGRISYIDMKTGAQQKVDGINLKVSLPSLSSPMRAEGSIVWNKEQLTLTAVLSNPNAALAGKTTDVDVFLQGPGVHGQGTRGRRTYRSRRPVGAQTCRLDRFALESAGHGIGAAQDLRRVGHEGQGRGFPQGQAEPRRDCRVGQSVLRSARPQAHDQGQPEARPTGP